MSDAKKRRLPVVKAPAPDETPEPRPGWQWIGFGVVVIFIAWLPLTIVAQKAVDALVARGAGPLAIVLPHAVALALAATVGGWVIGRFGSVGWREGALAGAAVGVASVALALASSDGSWALVVVVGLAAAFAALGGALGRRAARRAGA